MQTRTNIRTLADKGRNDRLAEAKLSEMAHKQDIVVDIRSKSLKELREAIVLKEILDKPKALRDR